MRPDSDQILRDFGDFCDAWSVSGWMEIETSTIFLLATKRWGSSVTWYNKSRNPLDWTGVGYGIPVLSHKKRPLETLDLINNILIEGREWTFPITVYRSTPGGGLDAFFSSRKNPRQTETEVHGVLKGLFFFVGGSKLTPNLSCTGVLDV